VGLVKVYKGCKGSEQSGIWCVCCVCLLWWLGRFKAVWLSMCMRMRVVKMVRCRRVNRCEQSGICVACV